MAQRARWMMSLPAAFSCAAACSAGDGSRFPLSSGVARYFQLVCREGFSGFAVLTGCAATGRVLGVGVTTGRDAGACCGGGSGAGAGIATGISGGDGGGGAGGGSGGRALL